MIIQWHAFDGSGVVRRSEVFDGNVEEGTTLAGMLAGLGAPHRALVVMDRGIATEESLVWLRAQGYRDLVVSRERQRQFDADAATSIQSASGDPIAVQRVLDAEGEEVRQSCWAISGESHTATRDQIAIDAWAHPWLLHLLGAANLQSGLRLQ